MVVVEMAAAVAVMAMGVLGMGAAWFVVVLIDGLCFAWSVVWFSSTSS